MRYLVSLSFILGSLYLQGFAQCPPDSQVTAIDSINSEAQEDDFQNNVNSLFSSDSAEIDTFAWNTQKINSGRFDWRNWDDTARIVLVDSSAGKAYVHPFENCVTSDFGARDWVWHYGVDIRLKKRDSVRAAFNGIVRVIENDRHGYGKVVVVRHCGGLETIYGHLCKTLVEPNEPVKAGEIVGLGGNTGRSSGSHLHFETRFYGEPFDPNLIIDFEAFALKGDTLILTKDDFTYLLELREITWHTIKRGETLGLLARRFHTTVASLCALNRISSRAVLRVGSRLAVNTNNRSDETYLLRPKRQPKA
jgi:hypothetical protein